MTATDRAASLPGPEWLKQRRAAAAASPRPMPSTSAESWRYTPINELDVAGLDVVEAAVTWDSAGFAGATDGDVSAPIEFLEFPEPDGVTDLHDALMQVPTVISIFKGQAVSRPIAITIDVPAQRAMSFPHVIIETGEASEALVVVTVRGGGEGALVVPVLEVRAGAASNIRVVSSQDLAPGTWHLGHVLARAARDANVRGWFVATGGSYSREYVSVSLPEIGATAHLAGVYFGDEDQVVDFRSLQDHVGTRTVSDFKLKGAVVDQARGVYTGLIRVHEGAKATESFLANRNLVLADGARVDSVPNLEIVNENDIKSCGHAAATGPVDEDHVFYLESRGVPTPAAQRLIVTGFFEEVLGAIPVAEVADAARSVVARKLGKVAAVGTDG